MRLMSDPYFFGYGSLVNRRTHVYAPALKASIGGWRRRWCATDLRPAAFLTAVPAPPDQRIDGMIAPVPGSDWSALDLREAGYDRHPAGDVRHAHGDDLSIAVYAMPERHLAAERDCPILLSYLDVVVQGFLTEFGPEGVARFFHTTDDWHLPVADDRAAPLYPRAQTLTRDEAAMTDCWLDHVGAKRVPATDTELGRDAAPTA